MRRFLNLGAGVQSTTLYLWAVDGEIEFEAAIFADTGDEPEAVYEHLEFLKTLGGPPIFEVRACENSLGENLKAGMNSTGQENQRHVSIPTFSKIDGSSPAIGRRQCTSEYKVRPIEKKARELVGLQPGQQSREQLATQIIGLSFDEPRRVSKTKLRFEAMRWSKPEFPLFDQFITRAECEEYLKRRLPGRKVPRSACVYCPYHSDEEWLAIRENPRDWARAVEIDAAIRDKTSVCTDGMQLTQYVHRSCVPLPRVEFKPKPDDNQKRIRFSDYDCEGMCGV